MFIIQLLLHITKYRYTTQTNHLIIDVTECSRHCSLCYNETQCYDCTPGYFLTENGECESKLRNLKLACYIYMNYLYSNGTFSFGI